MGTTEQHRTFVVLDGPGTVERAPELRERLLTGLGQPGSLLLDFAGLTEAHASVLQMVCATHRAAVARGRAVEWVDPGPALELQAEALGFGSGACGRAEGCLWARVRP